MEWGGVSDLFSNKEIISIRINEIDQISGEKRRDRVVSGELVREEEYKMLEY